MKNHHFNQEWAYSYYAIACPSPMQPLVCVYDSANNIIASHIAPFAGTSAAAVTHQLSFDRNKHLYIASDFAGTISYVDKTGSHTMSSNSGSKDCILASSINATNTHQ
jgi:hypothetical protein